MFTGLVEAIGTIVAVIEEPPGLRLVVDAAAVADDVALGASVSVSGCCLSAVAIDRPRLTFDVGPETLAKTSLGRLRIGGRVNLERPLRLSDRLGGHLVTGHVDGVGTLASREQQGDWVACRFTAPASLVPQLVSKGSIAVDGVSLTVVAVNPDGFTVALIPHTLTATTLGSLRVRDPVNLETDLIGKYVLARAAAWSEAPMTGGVPAPGRVQS